MADGIAVRKVVVDGTNGIDQHVRSNIGVVPKMTIIQNLKKNGIDVRWWWSCCAALALAKRLPRCGCHRAHKLTRSAGAGQLDHV